MSSLAETTAQVKVWDFKQAEQVPVILQGPEDGRVDQHQPVRRR